MEEGVPIESRLITRRIEKAQEAVLGCLGGINCSQCDGQVWSDLSISFVQASVDVEDDLARERANAGEGYRRDLFRSAQRVQHTAGDVFVGRGIVHTDYLVVGLWFGG